MSGKTIKPGSGSEILFSISADTEEEISAWVQKFKGNGGTILCDAKRLYDGFFYCLFADLDGHKFNVLLNEKGM
jgi:uncharacterized protein